MENEIKWNEKLSLNIDEIDNQHKKIFNIINQLNEDFQRQVEPERLKIAFLELTIFICRHFKTEESYMKRYDYPEYQSHKDHHMEFTAKLIDQIQAFENNPENTLKEALTQLNSWLVDDHMWLADRRFGGYVYKKLSAE